MAKELSLLKCFKGVFVQVSTTELKFWRERDAVVCTSLDIIRGKLNSIISCLIMCCYWNDSFNELLDLYNWHLQDKVVILHGG